MINSPIYINNRIAINNKPISTNTIVTIDKIFNLAEQNVSPKLAKAIFLRLKIMIVLLCKQKILFTFVCVPVDVI